MIREVMIDRVLVKRRKKKDRHARRDCKSEDQSNAQVTKNSTPACPLTKKMTHVATNRTISPFPRSAVGSGRRRVTRVASFVLDRVPGLRRITERLSFVALIVEKVANEAIVFAF